MLIREILEVLEAHAPFSLQENYDNSGLQIGHPQTEVSKGMICIDVTESIIDEALEKNCDLVISHHPLLFSPIKSLNGKNEAERVVIKAIQNHINVISVHTNLDSVNTGVNFALARKLGLENQKILQPRKGLLKKLVTFCPEAEASRVREAIFAAGAGQIGEYDCCSFNISGKGSFRAGDQSNPYVGEKGSVHFEPEIRIETILPDYLVQQVISAMIEAHPYEEVAYDIYTIDNSFEKVGSGMIGNLPQPISEKDFLNLLRKNLNIPCIRHSAFSGRPIQKVALCGGSGSFLRHKAISSGADAFITADIRYHEFFDAQSKILMADVGHYESEQFTKEILYEILSKKITNFALLISELDSNPVRYYC